MWLDLGLLILRLSFGLTLAFSHGIGKFPVSEQFVQGVGAMGFPFPTFFAWAAALSEFVGALFIALGLFIRPSAFFVACTMATAAFITHAKDPFRTKEMALLYLFAAVSLFFTGGGRFELEKLIRRRGSL